MNQAASPQPELPFGPRMRSFMSLVGVACGVYLAADKHRRARLAGVEITPQNPLEAVLAQSGVEFPNLEAVLVRLMGDTPEAKDAASIIVNHPDPAQLIREFAMRSTAPKSEESSTTSTSSPPPTATPTPPPSAASAPAESAAATPPPQAPPAAPSAAEPQQPPAAPQPSVFTPGSDYAPSPAHGAAYIPNYAPAAQAYHPGYAPQGAVFRPDYAPHPPTQWPGYAPHAPMYRADYAPPPGAYRPGYAPSPQPRGIPPLPAFPHHARAGGRFRPPPIRRPCPASQPSSDAAAPSPTSQPSPNAAAPSPSEPPTSAAPDRDAASSEPRTFLDWMKDKLATIERQREAELAELRRSVADDLHRLERVEAIINRLEAAERDSAAIPSNADPSTVTSDAAVQTTAEPADAGTTVSEVTAPEPPAMDPELTADNRASIDAETENAGDDAEPTAGPVEGSRDNATSTATEAMSASPPATTASKPDEDGPPLPSPEEMVEATRLLIFHEERMRELDAEAYQERDGYIRRLIRVEDQCTALALVRDHQIP